MKSEKFTCPNCESANCTDVFCKNCLLRIPRCEMCKDAMNLTEGNHTIEIRVLHKRYNNLYYTPVYSCDFTTLKDTAESETLKTTNSNSSHAALISSLVVISIISVAAVSRKTKLAK